jgi:hypothetical protein
MKIKVIYGNRPTINKKVLEVDNKFQALLVTEDCESQKLMNELHQIIKGEIKNARYVVLEADSKKMMYTR